MAGLNVQARSRLLDRISHLEHYWYAKNVVTVALLPLSWIFCALVALRRGIYRFRNRASPGLPVPVIVVGNISVGGTGKTPLVIWLVNLLKLNGYKPGVISRGYGGRARSWPQRVTADSDPALVGDEPVLIALRTGCPTAVGPRRSETARHLLDEHDCDVLISDDGLQHYGLPRDIEVAVVEGDRGIGNGWCLPAGPLREPPSRLSRVDFVVTQGASAEEGYAMSLSGERARNLRDPSITRLLNSFARAPVHAVAGIGNPKRFFDMLRGYGLAPSTHAFPDHHRFAASDIDFGDENPVLMTEKDAVKCRAFAQAHHWYLPVTAQPDESLACDLLAKLRSREPAAWRGGRQTMETS